MAVKKVKNEVATIDCALVTIETDDGEFGLDTASKVEVEPQTETSDAVKLVIKGKLKAQKPAQVTVTGNKITLTDNLFIPELVLVLQGGTIVYDTPANPNKIKSYTPPVVGSSDKGEIFKLNCYSAQYNAAGKIVQYEKITYPNCTGEPVAFNSEDDVFRSPEYVINSAPNDGEAPYKMEYMDSLPELAEN